MCRARISPPPRGFHGGPPSPGGFPRRPLRTRSRSPPPASRLPPYASITLWVGQVNISLVLQQIYPGAGPKQPCGPFYAGPSAEDIAHCPPLLGCRPTHQSPSGWARCVLTCDKNPSKLVCMALTVSQRSPGGWIYASHCILDLSYRPPPLGCNPMHSSPSGWARCMLSRNKNPSKLVCMALTASQHSPRGCPRITLHPKSLSPPPAAWLPHSLGGPGEIVLLQCSADMPRVDALRSADAFNTSPARRSSASGCVQAGLPGASFCTALAGACGGVHA